MRIPLVEEWKIKSGKADLTWDRSSLTARSVQFSNSASSER